MTVLIAGCGDLGTEAGLLFAAGGHRVVGLRRSPHRLPARIEGLRADLTETLPPLPEDTDVVVISTAADRSSPEAYRAAYVDSLRNLLDALERDGISARRVLLVSSSTVYGVTDGSWVDEETRPRPASATAAVVREAEELLHERLPHATVLRLTGIYGPGRPRLIEQVRGGAARLADEPEYTNRIHRDDAAAAIVHLTTMDPAPGPLYLGVDSEPADRADVLRFLAGELNVEQPRAGAAAAARGHKRCRNGLLLGTGFTFTYPTYREGYRAVLAGCGVRHD